MEKRSLIARVEDGETMIGTSVHLTDAAVVELMALAGFDWVSLTLENSIISTETYENMQRAADLRGMPTLLHVGSLDDPRIVSLMHSGVDGLVLQQARTAADAEALVKISLFPPLGSRAAHSGVRSDTYGTEDYAAFMKAADERFVVALAIEDLDGVENVEAMLAVEGINLVFVGLHDISHAVGAPNDLRHPRVMEALARVRSAAAARGIPLGLPAYAHSVGELHELGARFILSPGNELSFFRKAFETHLAAVRGELPPPAGK